MNMKNLLLTSIIMLTFCNLSSAQTDTQKEREFTIEYGFPEIGEQPAPTGDLFKNYLLNKKIMPDTFQLTFKNELTGKVTAITGKWDEKIKTDLSDGTYKVSGYSRPNSNNPEIIDYMPLVFDQAIQISDKTTSIRLNAMPEGYIILFPSKNVVKANHEHYSGMILYRYKLKKMGDYYYMALPRLYGRNHNLVEIYGPNNELNVVDLAKGDFQTGYFYLYEPSTGNFRRL